MFDLQQWAQDIRSGARVPIGILLDGVAANLRSARSDSFVPERDETFALEYPVGETGFSVGIACDIDRSSSFATLSARLRAGKSGTGRISGVRILNLSIPVTDAKQPMRLVGITGGFWDFSNHFPPASLAYWEKEIGHGEVFVLDSDRTGRSSNSQTPLWVLSDGNSSVWFGPEWSGCWQLEIRRDASCIGIRIGLPTFDFRMRADETITLPAVSFGSCQGGLEAGLNHLRATIRERFLPSVGNDKPIPPVVFQGLGGLPAFQDETTLYREADLAGEIGCEAFVLDAGWYNAPRNEEWYATLGDWTPSPERFPLGMQRFADHVHSKGMRFGLWLEPRVKAGSKSFEEVRAFVLAPNRDGLETMKAAYGSKDIPPWADVHLLDLSRVEAQEWMVRLIERFITEYKADWIWLDFNTDPRTVYWDALEDEGRRGLLELGFYLGLYRVFETMHERHPAVWLETCATGGRCIDLGMLRRFHSIWINDNSWDDDINRNFRTALNKFLPPVCLQNALFIPASVSARVDDSEYGNQHFLTHFGGVLQFGQGFVHWKERDRQNALRFAALYKRYRAYLDADYHALFEPAAGRNAWDGWQYHDSRTNSGIIVLFRLNESVEEWKTVFLRDLEVGAGVRVDVIDGKAIVEGKNGKGQSDRAIDASFAVWLPVGEAALLHYAREPDARA